jgi:hypothetical protein
MESNELNLLVRSLKILASNASQQKEYLRNLGTYPSTDEIAIEFDDAFKSFISYNEDEKLEGTEFLLKINLINDKLDSFSSLEGSEIWYVDSLDKESWCEIRQLAIDSISALDYIS